jgi:hypothetical protein
VISRSAAQRLANAGVQWHPGAGDRFAIRSDQLADEVFTVSDMVVEAREYPTGTVLAFNGTTEWALDSVRQEDAMWLPREDQLRELLGPAFRSLARSTTGWYQVLVEIPGRPEQAFGSESPDDAYAEAVLALVAASR